MPSRAVKQAVKYVWDQIDEDSPLPQLYRRKIEGEQILVARISLEKGCVVPKHHHPSEQISVILSGRIKFIVGEDPEREFILQGGEVMHLPGDVPHGVEVLEDTVVFDLLSPPGAMGVDQQSSQLG